MQFNEDKIEQGVLLDKQGFQTSRLRWDKPENTALYRNSSMGYTLGADRQSALHEP